MDAATKRTARWNLAAGLILGLALGMILIAVLRDITGFTYRQGQIDALTGNIHYELITHPDSTRTWERIE